MRWKEGRYKGSLAGEWNTLYGDYRSTMEPNRGIQQENKLMDFPQKNSSSFKEGFKICYNLKQRMIQPSKQR
jgi:hypothetical protein